MLRNNKKTYILLRVWAISYFTLENKVQNKIFVFLSRPLFFFLNGRFLVFDHGHSHGLGHCHGHGRGCNQA